ncbi:hypothetical protein [Priestia megaterium]|uniref:hypothetical protein n=1 Tax=Priestia megaterium TaxID=1404 RepID=UPI0011BBDADD|nr:hypothetical protein [Priestia megaterium]QDZ80155.1 hypothetical protein D0440_12160 [Priestia megaterium]
MAGSVSALIKGFTFQKLIFWIEASKIFDTKRNIKSVAFETADNKSFDDVKIEYEPEIVGDSNTPYVTKDYYQVKFHTTISTQFTIDDLMNPKFIGATRYSLLQKLKSAVTAGDRKSRYNFLTSWDIAPNDLLHKIVDENGAVKLDKLFDGKEKSAIGKKRKQIMNHLELSDEEELREIIKLLRIKRAKDYHLTYEEFNVYLKAAKLRTIDSSHHENPYSPLYDRMVEFKKTVFTKDSLQAILLQNNLFEDMPSPDSKWYESVFQLLSKLELMIENDMSVYPTSIYPGSNGKPKHFYVQTTDYIDIYNKIEQKMAFPFPHYLYKESETLKSICTKLCAYMLTGPSVSKAIGDLYIEFHQLLNYIKAELTGKKQIM